jgi:tetratricopeptide (TPR) repeat protein
LLSFKYYQDQAAKALQKGDVVLAYRYADFATHYLVNDDCRKQSDTLMKQIAEQAKKFLAAADAQFSAGKYAEALTAYRQLVGMSKLPTAAQAQAKLRDAARDPVVADFLREASAAILFDHAELLLAGWTSQGDTNAAASDKAEAPANGAAEAETDETIEARQAARLGLEDRMKLVQLLDPIAHSYADTPTGQKAEKLLKQMLADHAVAAAIQSRHADDDARSTYQMAKAYALSKMPDKARELFQKVVADYPNSEWAQQAKKDLGDMGASGAPGATEH